MWEKMRNHAEEKKGKMQEYAENAENVGNNSPKPSIGAYTLEILQTRDG